MQMAWRVNRLALLVGGLALLAGTPAVLVAAKVRNPWLLAGATAATAVVVVFGAVWQERYKRLVQRRDELGFRVQDGCLVLADGRLPVVRDIADPVRLGVHRAVSLPGEASGGAADSSAPAYVPRDIDGELREQLAAGGFVLLTGDSTAGKSRAAFQAVSGTLSGHVLICPSGREAISAAVDMAAEEPRCVLWLDDLERYLGRGGLTAAHLTRLLTGEDHHRVIVATIRAAEQARIAADAPDDEAGRQITRDIRQVLDQAYPVRLARMFSDRELERARARGWDPRIAAALEHAGSYGIAEYLAAGPELLRDWQDARDSSSGPHARGAALVAAAVDIRRAGYLSPIPQGLLDQVHERYLTDPEHVQVPREPQDQAWAWATRQRRATAALIRPAGPGLIEVFDYLVDTVQRRAGHSARVPEEVVRAALGHAGAADADSLAAAAFGQSRYALAEEAWRKAYQATASALGPDHPDTLDSRSRLALALQQRGRLDEAEGEYSAVLEARNRILGPGHPRTLASRNGLAFMRWERGQFEEAEREIRAVLEDRSRILGPDHSDTLDSRSQLGVVLSDRGQYAAAEQELRAVVEARTRILGPEDPATLVGRHNLARTLLDSGQLDQAEAENRAILEIRIRTLGPDHLLTLTNRGNLALLLHDSGQLEEAERENRAVVEAFTRVLGPEHPNTLLSRSNLAEILLERGRLDEAEEENTAVLETVIRLFGPEHRETLSSRHYRALILRNRGQLDEAEREIRAVLEARNRMLGPGHRDTLSSRRDLAETLRIRESGPR